MKVTSDVTFAIIPEWVLDADISPQAVRLYGALARHADSHNKARPSRVTLAKRLRVKSPRTIDAALAELEAIGAIGVTKRYTKRGDQTSNEYVLHVQPRGAQQIAMGVANPDATPLAEDCAQNESPSEPDSVSNETAADVLKAVLKQGTAYPKRFKGQLAREVKALLDEGFDFQRVTEAAESCVHKGLSPTNLPSLYVQATNGGGGVQTPYTSPAWGRRSDHKEPACKHADPMCDECRRENLIRFRRETASIGLER